MNNDNAQTLAVVRKLVRTFSSRPDPRRRAREILSELERGSIWSPSQQLEIARFSTWLGAHPPLGELHAACVRLLGMLESAPPRATRSRR